MFAQIEELGINTRAGQEKLFAAKILLLAHLKKEDNELYPVLQKKAETDSNLAYILRLFAKDMESITAKAINFFEKYGYGGAGRTFGRDFESLVTALKGRISREEHALYKEYESIEGSQATDSCDDASLARPS
jgi:hypothetical protein